MDMPFDDNLVVVDVRRETEFGDGHIARRINVPLDELTDPERLRILKIIIIFISIAERVTEA